MATYAIGDIQGCFRTLTRLLDRIDFDSRKDRLWLTGDLVNRGPRSLETLRWAMDAGPSVTTVLGNHDLHLVFRALGLQGEKEGDTLETLLGAPDVSRLTDWLRARPLVHREGNFLLVHAGLLPAWGIGMAEELAREVESALRGAAHLAFLTGIRQQKSADWKPGMSPPARAASVIRTLTRIRTCDTEGRHCPDFSGPPDKAPVGCFPWFDLRRQRRGEPRVVFGHWSALGLHVTPGFLGLDTGCVWGRTLTAIRLEDEKIFSERMAG